MGLLGGASALALLGGSQASAAPSVSEADLLQPAHSFAELLDPIPNAARVLRAENERSNDAAGSEDKPMVMAEYYYHHHYHHHHHHHHYYHHHHHHIITIITTTTITIITITREMLTASALCLTGAGLPPLGSEFAWSVDPFGFSRRIAVSLGKLVSDLLDWLGFPWILSSESRLFSGLHEINQRKFFRRLCRWHGRRYDGR